MDEIIKECRQQVTAEKLKARKEREERERDIEYTPNHERNLWIGPIIFFTGIIILGILYCCTADIFTSYTGP